MITAPDGIVVSVSRQCGAVRLILGDGYLIGAATDMLPSQAREVAQALMDAAARADGVTL